MVATAMAQERRKSSVAPISYAKRPSEAPTLLTPLHELMNDDEESGDALNESLNRPLSLTSAVYVGLGCTMMVMLVFGICFAKVCQIQ